MSLRFDLTRPRRSREWRRLNRVSSELCADGSGRPYYLKRERIDPLRVDRSARAAASQARIRFVAGFAPGARDDEGRLNVQFGIEQRSSALENWHLEAATRGGLRLFSGTRTIAPDATKVRSRLALISFAPADARRLTRRSIREIRSLRDLNNDPHRLYEAFTDQNGERSLDHSARHPINSLCGSGDDLSPVFDHARPGTR